MSENLNNLTTDEAHYYALESIIMDASMGLIPCHDYLHAFYQAQGKTLPEPKQELVHHLNHSRRLLHEGEAFKRIQRVFAKYGVKTPIGLEDLPIYWGLALEKLLDEINWVEPVPEESRVVCQWDFIQPFGAYLSIQYPRYFKPRDPEWPAIGSYLVFLHRLLEPGPFTEHARYCEFF